MDLALNKLSRMLLTNRISVSLKVHGITVSIGLVNPLLFMQLKLVLHCVSSIEAYPTSTNI